MNASDAIGARSVLLIEDEARLRTMLMRAIPDMGYEPRAAESGEAALRIMQVEPVQIVILDLNLPGMHGMEVFEKLHQSWPNTSVIILTGFGSLDAAKQAIHLDVVEFLTKPCSLGELESALDRARRQYEAKGTQPSKPMPDLSEPPPTDQRSTAATNLRAMEREAIENALLKHDGNRTAAAEDLGISVRTLYYRLREYDAEDEMRAGETQST